MPNRMLREGILDSEAVNALDPAAELFYRRLMSVVDDFGRFDARPVVLRTRLYAFQLHRVGEADVVQWLDACVAAGLVATYSADSRQFLVYRKFGQHIRAAKSKWPEPPLDIEDAARPHSACSADASHALHGCDAHAPHPRSKTKTKTNPPPPRGGEGSGSDVAPAENSKKRPAKGSDPEAHPLFARLWEAYPARPG